MPMPSGDSSPAPALRVAVFGADATQRRALADALARVLGLPVLAARQAQAGAASASWVTCLDGPGPWPSEPRPKFVRAAAGASASEGAPTQPTDAVYTAAAGLSADRQAAALLPRLLRAAQADAARAGGGA